MSTNISIVTEQSLLTEIGSREAVIIYYHSNKYCLAEINTKYFGSIIPISKYYDSSISAKEEYNSIYPLINNVIVCNR